MQPRMIKRIKEGDLNVLQLQHSKQTVIIRSIYMQYNKRKGIVNSFDFNLLSRINFQLTYCALVFCNLKNRGVNFINRVT